MPNHVNPQSLNRFSYVRNNPLRYTDPTGHMDWEGDDGGVACLVTNTCSTGSGGNGGGSEGGNDPKDMEISSEGEEFIKDWEQNPPPLYPYVDGGGNCTIGWGHRLFNPDREGCSGWPNQTYGNGITTQLAQKFFDSDVKIFEDLIKETITVDLTQAQFDALVSYSFNTGDQTNNPYFVKGIPELINSGNFKAAAEAIRGGPNTTGPDDLVMPKLVERRQREADLFLFGIYFP